jgi:hypothetical protein
MNLKSLLQKTAVIAAFCVAGTAALAQQTETIDSGVTAVKLSSEFTGALSTLKVAVGTVPGTHVADGYASFPIIGGAIDLQTASGNILHSGGLTLTAGSTEVRLQSFTIDTTGSTPVITGLVVANNKLVGRVTLFDLAFPAGFSTPIKADDLFQLVLLNVNVTLSSEAATALNGVFQVSAFKEGLPIGVARVYGILNPAAE